MNMLHEAPPRTGKARQKTLTGVCGRCGFSAELPTRTWLIHRLRESWPACPVCLERMYPAKRKCQDCQTILRDGNLSRHCALCTAKQIAANAIYS